MLIVSLLVVTMALILFIIKIHIPIFTIFLVIALEPFLVTDGL
jgi:hypothetical protein